MVMLIPIVIGAFGIVTKRLIQVGWLVGFSGRSTFVVFFNAKYIFIQIISSF